MSDIEGSGKKLLRYAASRFGPLQGDFMRVHFVALFLVSLTLAWAGPQGLEAGQIKVYPGSATRGSMLLGEKGCLTCHSFNERGGKRAPDLGKPSAHTSSPEILASAMWNHGPSMWAAERAGQFRNITSTDAADIFAYLYATLFFTSPGNAVNGKAVFGRNCGSCHSASKRVPYGGPPISDWVEVNDLSIWAERMWNHSGPMFAKATREKKDWPLMSGKDVNDLLLYVRQLRESRSYMAQFMIGEAELGRSIFDASCDSCHSFSDLPFPRLNLLSRPVPKSPTDVIAALWNHAPAMHRKNQNDFPKMKTGEMPHLVAFLFSQQYFFVRGNSDKGAQVFQSKNCSSCHEARGKLTGAPDLTQSTEVFSPITLISAMWRHGPAMFDKIEQSRMVWPKFHASEMADLITYLNSRLVPRVAGGFPDF